MRTLIITLIALLSLCTSALAQRQHTRQGAINQRVRSLQVHPEGYPLAPPVIELLGPGRIQISFDHLSEDYTRLRFRLLHCNASWQPSSLVESEYVDGFNEGIVDDYDFSRQTTTHYVHYSLLIPQPGMTPLVSGNYLVQVYPEDDPDDTWLQARFLISEQLARIGASVTSRTDKDYNDAHQQLSLTVDTELAGVADAFNDVTVKVQQNGRWDNEATLQKPLRLASRSVAVYEHLPQLIFPAGNEYRRFEIVSTQYPGMGVEAISWNDPYYNFTLYTDEPRSDLPYSYDQTQHGRFTPREYNSTQSDVEADYAVVHFSLDMQEVPGAMVFIDGDMTQRRYDPESLIVFNRATGRYERAMLLKQGAYNYQYLVVPNGSDKGQTAPVEGDKYQTVNEYTVKVYTRGPTDRYDRLIGVQTITSGI